MTTTDLEQPDAAAELAGGPSPIRKPGESFGEFALRIKAWLATPRGLQLVAREERERVSELNRYAAERRVRVASEIGIPERYRFMGSPSNDPVDTLAMQAVKLAQGEMLVLSGGTGCGKTAAACWWLYQVQNDLLCQSLFITGARLSRMSRFDEEVMAGVFGAHRLVIDDLAVEYADEKGFFRSLLDEIINERYANKRQTVITTNVDVDTFRVRCGERIADRIREAGQFVSLGNPSLRRHL